MELNWVPSIRFPAYTSGRSHLGKAEWMGPSQVRLSCTLELQKALKFMKVIKEKFFKK